MNAGSAFGFFGKLLHFNGGLFKSPVSLPLDQQDLQVLHAAAKCTWNKVEPAIFGALFEGALAKRERHHLGAHFTPRPYVERLVRPTIEEPIREDWSATQSRIRALASSNRIREAKAETRAFMRRLSDIRVLDPACGSGNFLYVALDLLKSVEDEAFALLLALEGGQTELCLDAPEVTPKQFLGIETNPRAKAIAELVLWIGYLQWHFRTKHRGGKPREPVLEDYKNVECRDAVLAFDSKEVATDERTGKPLSRWDGETKKKHPATGELVPDDRFTTPIYSFTNAREAPWPKVEFIIGNPPFIGNKRMRTALGDGYADALRAAYPGTPASVDLVMYWWHKAAEQVRTGVTRRFGFVSTSSIVQGFNQSVVSGHLNAGISLSFACADHPWVDTSDGAAVRIAMSVGVAGHGSEGRELVVEESDGGEAPRLSVRHGVLGANLRAGPATASASTLRANVGLCFTGMYPLGQGFVLSVNDIATATGGSPFARTFVKPFYTARDLMRRPRNASAIDVFPLPEPDVRARLPHVWQWLHDRVKPQRDQETDKAAREKWWLFARPRTELRGALKGLTAMVLVPRTAKHFVFQRFPVGVVPDSTVVAIAVEDDAILGVLSSRVHLAWAREVGGKLGVGNDPRYQHEKTFNQFPFPVQSEASRRRIAAAMVALDEHRRARVKEQPQLTLTDLYNTLAKVRSGEQLGPQDLITHRHGLVAVLRQLHDELDAAVLDAYDWPYDIGDDEIRARLVALNAERAEEERRGIVRWVRPEYQESQGQSSEVAEDGDTDDAAGPGLRKSVPPKGPGIATARSRTKASKAPRKSGGKR
jgi:hypothetical protein